MAEGTEPRGEEPGAGDGRRAIGGWLRPTQVIAALAIALAGGFLLWLYARHASGLFEPMKFRWLFYYGVAALDYLRTSRAAEPVLIVATVAVAAWNALALAQRLGVPRAGERALAGLTFWLALLVVPFQALLAISILTGAACVLPFNLLVAQMAVAAGFAFRRRPPARALPPVDAMPGDPAMPRALNLIGRVALMIGVLATLLGFGSVLAQTQQQLRGYDALWYHLPLGLMWRDYRSAAVFASDSLVNSYPSNAEVLYYYATTAGLAGLASAVQWLASLLTAAMVCRIARRLGAGAAAAVLLGCAYLLLPVTMSQATFGGNDLVLTGLLMLAAAWLTEATAGGPAWLGRRLAMGALAYGMGVGVKYNAIFLLPAFGLWGAWLIRRASRSVADPRRRWRRAGRLTGVVVLLMLLPCGFWYVRNMAVHGSPVYPYGVTIAGEAVVSGEVPPDHGSDVDALYVKSPAHWWIFPFEEPLDWRGGWGATMAVADYPLLFGAILLLIFGRRFAPNRRVLLFMLCVAMVSFWLGWALATWRETRYNLPGYALMFAAGGAVFAWLPPLPRLAGVGLLAASLVLNAGYRMHGLRVGGWTPGVEWTQPEIANPVLMQVLDGLPPSRVEANIIVPYEVSLYGTRLQHHVFTHAQVSPETVRADNCRYAVYFTADNQPNDLLAGKPDEFRLLFENDWDGKHFKLFENLKWRDPNSLWVREGIPTPISAVDEDQGEIPVGTFVDNDKATFWESWKKPHAKLTLLWDRPVVANGLDLHWGGNSMNMTNIELRSGGKWRRVRRIRSAQAGGGWADRHTDVTTAGKPFDGLRITAWRSSHKTRFSEEPEHLKLFDIKVYPSLGWDGRIELGAFGVLVLVLIGVAVRPPPAAEPEK